MEKYHPSELLTFTSCLQQNNLKNNVRLNCRLGRIIIINDCCSLDLFIYKFAYTSNSLIENRREFDIKSRKSREKAKKKGRTQKFE